MPIGKLLITFALLVLSGCASLKEVSLNERYELEKYKCLSPKHLTVIAMKWDTCPLLSRKPSHLFWNARWDVQPIITEINREYLKFELSKKDKLNKSERNCTIPTIINEIIELPKNNEIHISKMTKFKNKAGEGIGFEGSTTISNMEYQVAYRGYLSHADNHLGYNLDDIFNLCANPSLTRPSI